MCGTLSSSRHNKEDYDDDVISFFIHCYHVRDWLLHLNTVGLAAKKIDAYINSKNCLRVCADLANGSKHYKLTRSLRTERQPHIAVKNHSYSTWITSNGGGEFLKCRYTTLCGENLYDALELATECVAVWESFISSLRSGINEQ